jgi:hypothetical protein
MVVFDRRHQEPTATQVGIQAAAHDQHGLLIDLSSSDLQGKNGFHFDNSEAGDQVLGRPLSEKIRSTNALPSSLR